MIFDTDMAGDCDDAGALAVLHALADRGEAKILAVVTNRKDAAGASGAACDAINTFYGRPDIPLGTDKDGSKLGGKRPSPYTGALASDFPHDSPSDTELPDAVTVYRHALANSSDESVVICSVGALSNLEDLLRSGPDEIVGMSGVDLIRAKVKRTVIMGGHFPHSSKPETNLYLDPAAAVSVAVSWPSEILWQGFEIGAALHCGASLIQSPDANPVRRSFELRPYLGHRAIDFGKPAHDQAAVLLAVRGAHPKQWSISDPGRVVIDSNGHTEFIRDPRAKHRYVKFRGRSEPIATSIDELMTAKPRSLRQVSLPENQASAEH
ncbi:MAG: nucleoside hydrolase [Planctomycetota bacterium]